MEKNDTSKWVYILYPYFNFFFHISIGSCHAHCILFQNLRDTSQHKGYVQSIFGVNEIYRGVDFGRTSQPSKEPPLQFMKNVCRKK